MPSTLQMPRVEIGLKGEAEVAVEVEKGPAGYADVICVLRNFSAI